MKNYIYRNLLIIGILGLSVSLQSCYEQQDPLDELIEATGNHYPVIANIRTLENQGYPVELEPNGEINIELQYWSIDPIREIQITEQIGENTATLIATIPYSAAFSERAGTDTLVFTYTVPATAGGSEISLDFEVINENSLVVNDGVTFNIPANSDRFSFNESDSYLTNGLPNRGNSLNRNTPLDQLNVVATFNQPLKIVEPQSYIIKSLTFEMHRSRGVSSNAESQWLFRSLHIQANSLINT